MEQTEIDRLHGAHWRKGWGSVSPLEVAFLQEQIRRFRPRRFIEIGTASGLSGGFIAALMAENGGANFLTIDRDATFFGDRTKPSGYLLGAIHAGDAVAVEARTGVTALDLDRSDGAFDMAFVDANHQHPWPLIDTLALAGVLDGPRQVIHHDLNLFKKQGGAIGIGPKYLWDQWPEARRERSSLDDGNIFRLDLDIPRDSLTRIAAEAFNLPWSLVHPLDASRKKAVRKLLEAEFPGARDAFDKGLRRYNAAGAAAKPGDLRRGSVLGRLAQAVRRRG